jgi:beta-lactamase superfamily II metal-dependent hydrolase
MKLQIFNVEHGACALLTCDNGARMMIDCGHNVTEKWYPGDYLRSIGVTYLDMLVITNYDQDHISGYPNLADRVVIGSMFRNATVTPQTIYQLKSEVGTVSPAMSRYINDLSGNYGGSGTWTPPSYQDVIWDSMCNPYPVFDDENNLSLLMYLNIKGTGFLFTGDLEKAGWLHLLASSATLRAAVKHTHILMASHHGRENGKCEELFDIYGCTPQIVVVSDAYKQHMSQETGDYYYSKCSGIDGFRHGGHRRVLTTRYDKEITFSWDSGTCVVY